MHRSGQGEECPLFDPGSELREGMSRRNREKLVPGSVVVFLRKLSKGSPSG